MDDLIGEYTLDRLRRQVMSVEEAAMVARWISEVAERIAQLERDLEYERVCSAAIADRDGWVKRAEAAEARCERLEESLKDAGAHLIGATSAYKTFAKRHSSQGKSETDALLSTRLKDFESACERVRAALSDGGEDDRMLDASEED